MMFDEITKVSHKLEDVFYFIRESHPTTVPHVELVEHVLDVSDFIMAEMDKLSDGGDADGDATEPGRKSGCFFAKDQGGEWSQRSGYQTGTKGRNTKSSSILRRKPVATVTFSVSI